MNTRAIAMEYRQAHWSRILRERLESGLSIKAYCEVNGIHPNTYFYWQKKLRETLCHEVMNTKEETARRREMVPSGWALCELPEMYLASASKRPKTEPPPPGQNIVRIQIGKGHLEIASAGNETIAAIIETMMRNTSASEVSRPC